MTINCKGKLIDLSVPKVMGVLNITPDSFYDGGKYKNPDAILSQTEKMLTEGATFIDVGAYSSRPGAAHVSLEEELDRMIPVVDMLLKNFPDILLSIDTFRSKVAELTHAHGAALINDISGGNMDQKMFASIAKIQVPYIVMHMQGTPQNMQNNPHYDDVVKDVYKALSDKSFALRQIGVKDIIADVGFGFGKTMAHNYDLLQNLSFFKNLGIPILTGVSRKSMLYKLLDIEPADALNATTVANTIALLQGTSILRVHDVREAVEAVKIAQQLK